MAVAGGRGVSGGSPEGDAITGGSFPSMLPWREMRLVRGD
eukprot:CAMPEP_0197589412 /NCGR_PEP_ID=MMETSP1326-20131121/10372_1 /TAXON_ID=1155430 /ORGANISM="Genus nov. species nov., Strain RCC2288" /LENGTH=39 /DNA_ID= /DNA_START= /DNA_END= /DNA_ORIENTATION=